MCNDTLNMAKKLPIKAPAKSVLLMLADRKNSDTGRCYPSIDTLAFDCGLNSRTVIRAVKELSEIGVILADKTKGKSTHYEFNFTAKLVSESHQCQTGTSDTQSPDQCHTVTKLVSESHPNQKEPEVTRSQYIYEIDDRDLANRMWEKIQPLTKANKPPCIESWANDIRLMRERDDRSLSEIENVFNWANQDSFWKANILSTSKLRQKFGQLYAQMSRGNSHANAKETIGHRTQPGRLSAGDEVRVRAAQRTASRERETAGEVIATVGCNG